MRISDIYRSTIIIIPTLTRALTDFLGRECGVPEIFQHVVVRNKQYRTEYHMRSTAVLVELRFPIHNPLCSCVIFRALHNYDPHTFSFLQYLVHVRHPSDNTPRGFNPLCICNPLQSSHYTNSGHILQPCQSMST